jgi:hypothetical protein
VEVLEVPSPLRGSVSFWGSSDKYFCIGSAWHVEVSEQCSLDL